MINSIISVLVGMCLGLFYGWAFLGARVGGGDKRAGLNRGISSFSRLVFVTIAIIAFVIYIDLNLILLLLGFMCAYWGMILGNIRAKR
jgi:hypothetical protein